MAALALTVVACNPDEKDNGSKIDWDKVTVNGFYVAGPATGFNEINGDCVMAAGYNEVDKALRDGMYEKYIVLEADKEFYLLYNDGGNKSRYSADLKEFVTPLEEVYTDNPEKVLKGALVVGESAPAMKVSKTGLYHIVLDINKTGDLDAAGGAQILLLDASDFGVRGAMNGWGFTSSDPAVTEFSNSGITFTFKDCEMPEGGKYKFATGGKGSDKENYWKVTLDDAGKVKAEVSLAADMTLNGGDIAPAEGAGIYDITLKFELKAGSFDRSFSYTETKTGEVAAAEQLFIIGSQFGNWDWNSEDVVEMTPVYYGNVEEYKNKLFWATRYITAGAEFKFCQTRAWAGDFGSFDAEGGIVGTNNKIEEAGFYTIYVNLVDKKVEIKPAEVYGFGDAVFTGGWDFDSAEKFAVEGDKLVITTSGAGDLRMASKVVPNDAIAGITTNNGWFDWWKTEFVFYEDGKIVYRGAGGDQDRYQMEGGKKITLDLNAGTATVEDGFEPAITIDGDATDWAEIAEFASNQDSRIRKWKFASDERFVYLSFNIRKNRSCKEKPLWIVFDTDNDAATGSEHGNVKGETAVLSYPFTNSGENTMPVIVAGKDERSEISGTGTSAGDVIIAGDLGEGELSESSSNVWIELSIPRASLNLPASGKITVGCSYDFYVTGTQEVTL